MKILDELERTADNDFMYILQTGFDAYLRYTTYGELVEKALPALIHVARAAEALGDSSVYDDDHVARKSQLWEALQQLRAMSGGGE